MQQPVSYQESRNHFTHVKQTGFDSENFQTAVGNLEKFNKNAIEENQRFPFLEAANSSLRCGQ